MAYGKELNEENFDAAIKEADKPLLVDFWAPWCGPCHMVTPILEALATRYAGKIEVANIDVDNAPGLATKYGIRSIPTLMIFKGGEVAERTVGVQPEDALASLIDKTLAG